MNSRHGLSRRRLLTGTMGALVAGYAVPALAGCGGGDSGGGSTSWQASTWESAAEMEKWKKYIGKYFTDNEPGTKWNVDFGIPFNDYFQKLQTTIAGGGDLDMCWMHGRFVPQFADAQLLEPLDDLIRDAAPPGWPDDYYPSQIQGFQVDGKQYGMPYDLASGGFFVNVDWFKRAGVDLPTEDWTFDDLLQAAIRLKAAARDPGKSFGVTLPTATVPAHWLVRSFGGEYFSDNGKTSHLADEGTITAFQYVYDAMWKHRVAPSPAELGTADAAGAGDFALFGSERLAIMFNLNDSAFAMKDFVKGKFGWTVAPTPRGVQRRFQQVGGSSFALPKTTRHPELSFKIMKYLMADPSTLPDIGKLGSLTPARMSFAKYGLPGPDVVPAEDFDRTFNRFVARDGAVLTFFPKYAEWESSIFNVKIDELWTNSQSDAGKVLKDIDSQTRDLIQG